MNSKNEILTLYGSTAKEANIIGYCAYHKANITARQLKEKKCLKKQCRNLRKRLEHPFWKSRKKKKDFDPPLQEGFLEELQNELNQFPLNKYSECSFFEEFEWKR